MPSHEDLPNRAVTGQSFDEQSNDGTDTESEPLHRCDAPIFR